MAGCFHILAYTFPLRLEYLTPLTALAMFVLLGGLIVWLGMRSLAGLGTARQWVAIGVRLTVLLLFILILGNVKWQQVNTKVEVMFVRDLSRSTQLVTDYPGRTLQTSLDEWMTGASATDAKKNPSKRGGDRVGLISFNEEPFIDALPSEELALDTRAVRDAGNGTDAAAAINMALASMGRDAMHRLVLIWDGNATAGDIESATAAAAAQHVPIDVFPLQYNITNEVMVDKLTSPMWRKEKEPFTIDVVIKSTNPVIVTAKMSMKHNDKPMPLDGDNLTRDITLKPGVNVEHVTVPPQEPGVHQFKATIEGVSNVTTTIHKSSRAGFQGERLAARPGRKRNVTADFADDVDLKNLQSASSAVTHLSSAPLLSLIAQVQTGDSRKQPASTEVSGDTLAENNSADIFTFVRGKGSVLLVHSPDHDGTDNFNFLQQALAQEGITCHPIAPDEFPSNPVELQNYDAILLVNVARGAGGIGAVQEQLLAKYIHDMGGGVVMIGGDNTYAIGGWQGSDLEKELPVDMEIPAQRQVAKGALVLVMHACEMPQGNYWGEQCALKAAETLSARDEIGVISYDWGKGKASWDYPLQEKGDGAKLRNAILTMQAGDMPSFDDSMNVALNGLPGQPGLLASDARQKHIIVISDGDPQAPNQSLMDTCIQKKITVSTITVYPHMGGPGGQLPPAMEEMATKGKGKAYGPINENPSQLPQIFIKEATVVRRSIIFEDRKGIPLTLARTASPLVRGFNQIDMQQHPLFGMDLTSPKNNPLVEIPITAGKNHDPVLAYWQAGLGKAAVYTGDAHNRWDATWVGWNDYGKFWSQVVRTVARPPMSNDFDVQMSVDGDKGHITVEALNKDNAFNNFVDIAGTVAGGPGLKSKPIHLVQTGPGTYEGDFDAHEQGNYISYLNYASPKGANGEPASSGVLLGGTVVNGSPELRDLQSNEGLLRRIADSTGGRMLDPWKPETADLFNRAGLLETASPQPIINLLIPILLVLIIIDVAVRRIAWDYAAMKRLAAAGADHVRNFTVATISRGPQEQRQTLDALKRVRDEVADTKFKQEPAAPAKPPPMPDPKAKFQAAEGVEGDITKVVGGATDKPIPSAPKKIEPKGLAGGSSMGGLMEAKRRAQQKIEDKKKQDGQ
jgi:uncharacterized membrane protein